ncbi:MAG: hypothetical protein KC912_14190 [Proteobacteria bacterium]|nr:hypothetical protein [Pseudomonadota bacterium]
MIPLLLLFTGCAEPKEDLLTASFADPADVSRISKFRSCCGHDYSHKGEDNRSMKHYIHPDARFGVSNDEMPVYAPFDGRVSKIRTDTRELPCFDDTHGFQVFIRPDDQPGVFIKLFHVNPIVEEGQRVVAGEQVAWADVRECNSSDESQISEFPSSFDIALHRLNKSFPVFTQMTPDVWAEWAEADELSVVDETVIPAAERDADPCTDYWQECEAGMTGLWGNEDYPPWW